MVSIFKSLAAYSLNKVETEALPMTKATEDEIFKEYKKALNAIPGLNVSHESDSHLRRFLRAKSYRINDAVKLYKSTEGWKEKNAEILNIPFSDCIPAYKSKVFTVLKEKTLEGRTMIVAKADNWNTAEITLETLIKSLFNLIEESQTNVENQINGIVIILMCENLTMAKTMECLTHFTLRNIKLLVGFAQGGSPVKVKQAYCTSAPLLAVTTYTTIKYLLKRKMRNRINFYYEGPSALDKPIGKDRLPESLGGTIPEELGEDTELMNSLYRKHNLIYSL